MLRGIRSIGFENLESFLIVPTGLAEKSQLNYFLEFNSQYCI